jgi:hypothetical protein
LIFGVPLFAFAVLSAVFSHPVIRGLGVVIVDADRSDTSRAFVQQVAASPGLSIVCPLLAQSGLSEIFAYLSAFWSKADVHGRVASTASVVNDPKRTSA